MADCVINASADVHVSAQFDAKPLGDVWFNDLSVEVKDVEGYISVVPTVSMSRQGGGMNKTFSLRTTVTSPVRNTSTSTLNRVFSTGVDRMDGVNLGTHGGSFVPGIYEVTVTLDPNNALTEANEGNNVITKTFTVERKSLATLYGAVVSAGKPVGAGAVSIDLRQNVGGPSTGKSAVTDAEGKFVMSGIDTTVVYYMYITGEGYQTSKYSLDMQGIDKRINFSINKL
jgi:hypothetical protein